MAVCLPVAVLIVAYAVAMIVSWDVGAVVAVSWTVAAVLSLFVVVLSSS